MCNTAFGVPVEPDVNRTAARSEGRAADLASVTGGPRPTRPSTSAGSVSTMRGSTCARAAAASVLPMP